MAKPAAVTDNQARAECGGAIESAITAGANATEKYKSSGIARRNHRSKTKEVAAITIHDARPKIGVNFGALFAAVSKTSSQAGAICGRKPKATHAAPNKPTRQERTGGSGNIATAARSIADPRVRPVCEPAPASTGIASAASASANRLRRNPKASRNAPSQIASTFVSNEVRSLASILKALSSWRDFTEAFQRGKGICSFM